MDFYFNFLLKKTHLGSSSAKPNTLNRISIGVTELPLCARHNFPYKILEAYYAPRNTYYDSYKRASPLPFGFHSSTKTRGLLRPPVAAPRTQSFVSRSCIISLVFQPCIRSQTPIFDL